MNVQSYATSELFLQNSSQTSKKPLEGQVKYFVNSKQGIFQIQCKISRSLWCTSEENGKSTSPAWRHVRHVEITNPHFVPPCHLVVVYNNHPYCHFVNSSQISIKTPCAILSSLVPWPTCFWKLPSPLKQVGRGTLRHLVTISKKIKLTLFHLVSTCLSTSLTLCPPAASSLKAISDCSNE